jgi:hypothetical protein
LKFQKHWKRCLASIKRPVCRSILLPYLYLSIHCFSISFDCHLIPGNPLGGVSMLFALLIVVARCFPRFL